MKKFFLVFLFFVSQATLAETISTEVKHIALRDAILIFANQANLNIIVSEKVIGTVSLRIADLNSQYFFQSLLQTHGLTLQQVNAIWWVGPEAEWILRAQRHYQLHDAYEASKPLYFHIWKIKFAKADEISQLIKTNTDSLLSKRGSVKADVRTNYLYVNDTLERLKKINRLIRSFDVPEPQIKIEARLVSIETEMECALGLHFSSVLPNKLEISPGEFSLAIASLADGSLLDIKLAALENKGHAEIISRPSLLAGNQEEASIEAGEEIPYQEVSLSGGTATAFKKAVLRLKVIPQLLPHQQILLKLQINQDRVGRQLVQGMPAILTRQMNTKVLLHNEETAILGGIYEDNNESGTEGIPFFTKIPFVGILFQQHNVAKHKRELLIFVTPKIIDAENEAYGKT